MATNYRVTVEGDRADSKLTRGNDAVRTHQA